MCVSFAQVVATLDKNEVSDFSYLVTRDAMGMIMPAPKQGSKAVALVLPFSSDVNMS